MDYRIRWQQRRRQKQRQRLLAIPAALLLGVALVWALRATGERGVVWEVQGPRHLLPQLAPGPRGPYVLWADGHVWALEAQSGQSLRSGSLFSHPDRFCGRPLVSGGVLYFGSDLGVMRALDESGQLLWQRETGGAIRGQPVLLGDALYFGSDNGNVYCLSARDGQSRWVRPLGAAVASDVAAGEQVIYAATTQGLVCALRAGSGAVVWQRELQTPVFSPVTVAGELVVVGSDSGEVHLLAAGSGQDVARYATRGPVRTGVAAGNETLCFAGTDGWVRGVSADGLTPRWQHYLGGPVTLGPLAMGEDCLVARRGRLVLLRLKDGHIERSWGGEAFGSSLLVTPEAIYAGTVEGRVIALARPR